MKLRGDRCHCRNCLEYFNSTRAFDRHRTGSYGTMREPGDRRCLTVPEMEARGMVRNAAGFWITGKSRRAYPPTERHSGDRLDPVPEGLPETSPPIGAAFEAMLEHMQQAVQP